MFSVVRVDDRVIHGQVVTAWLQQYPCDALLIVDDEIGSNEVLKNIFKNAAIGKRAYIFTFNQALVKVREAADSDRPYFLIAKSPVVYANLHKAGINIGKKVILGPVSGGGDRKLIAQTTSLNEEEIASCDYLTSQGIEVVFQSIPAKPSIPWKSVAPNR